MSSHYVRREYNQSRESQVVCGSFVSWIRLQTSLYVLISARKSDYLQRGIGIRLDRSPRHSTNMDCCRRLNSISVQKPHFLDRSASVFSSSLPCFELLSLPSYYSYVIFLFVLFLLLLIFSFLSPSSYSSLPSRFLDFFFLFLLPLIFLFLLIYRQICF